MSFRGARVHVRGYLDRFLFESGQCDMAVGKLSGGEQSRLLLAQLMLREAQVLVLDEPTNDLDLATLSVLEETLTEFDGAVLLVSHDRYFVDRVATTILAFDATAPPGTATVTPFADLAQWEAWRAERAAAAAGSGAAAAQPATAGDDACAAGGPGASASATRSSANTTASRPSIAAAEAALRETIADSERPENASDHSRLVELLAAVAQRQTEVDQLYARWAELEAKLA